MEFIIGLSVVVLLVFCLTTLRGAPYVPTHSSALNVLFDELLDIGKDDLVIDIGSGDGTVLRAAARRGASALGYEINPFLVAVSRLLSYRHKHLIHIKLADFWQVKFPSKTTIVYTFGESRDIQKMYNKVQRESTRLAKPLRFVSYGFTIDGVEPLAKKAAMTIYQVTPLQR